MSVAKREAAASRSEYDIHPYSLIFPPMSKQDFDALAEEMRDNGMRDAITLYDGKIVDGRNRYRACLVLGIKPHFESFDGDDEAALAFVISKNLARRHLNEAQRAMIAESLETIRHGQNQHTLNGGDANLHVHITREDAAKKLNVSPRSVATARKIKQNATPEVRKAVEARSLDVFQFVAKALAACRCRANGALGFPGRLCCF